MLTTRPPRIQGTLRGRIIGHTARITTGANHQAQRGLTLIEVLIALLVLSIGLLGMAGLQTMSLKTSHGSYLGSQATILAYDMADRIRANPDFPLTGNDLAATDTGEWQALVTKVLPRGVGTITATTDEFVITVAWDTPYLDDGTTGEDKAPIRDSYPLRILR